MLKIKLIYTAIVILGIFMFAVAILGTFMFQTPKNTAIVYIGIGTTLIALGLPHMITNYLESTKPEFRIESNDERSIMIHNKSKAKAGDIIQWFILLIFYISILADIPSWFSIAIIAVFILQNILFMFFNIKYQKEL